MEESQATDGVSSCERLSLNVLEIQYVQNLSDYVQAFRVLHDEWFNASGSKDWRGGLRFSLLQLMPGSRTIIARQDGRMVGTISLCFFDEAALPGERRNLPELTKRVSQGQKVGEVQMFAVLPRYGGARVQVAESLMFAAIKVLLDEGFDEAIFWVQPAQSRFFARCLGNEPMSNDLRSTKILELDGVEESSLMPFHLQMPDLLLQGSGSFPLLVLNANFALEKHKQYRLSDEEVALLLIKVAELEGRISLQEAQILAANYPGAAEIIDLAYRGDVRS